MGVRVVSSFGHPAALRQGAATSDRINHGQARIPNLTQANFLATGLIIFRLNTYTTNRVLISKNALDGQGGFVMNLNNSSETFGLGCQFNRTSVNALARSDNVGALVGEWVCVAGIVDVSDTQPRIYIARLGISGSQMTEVSYDGAETQGSGNSNSSAILAAGNTSAASPGNALQADIHRMAFYPARLTPVQMMQWMQEGFAAGAPAPYVNVWYGRNGKSIQFDDSGYHNHGRIEGAATAVVEGPAPLIAPQRERRRNFKKGATAYFITPSGSIASSGALVKQTGKPLAGGLAPSAAFAKQMGKLMAGALTPAGAPTKSTSGSMSGSCATSGGILKQIGKPLTGSLTPSGVFTGALTLVRSLAGSIGSAGALVKSTAKALAGALAPAGTNAYETGKSMSGSCASGGGIVKSVGKPLAGGVTPSGALSTLKVVLLTFTGAITPAGTLVRSIGKALAGTLAPSGAFSRTVSLLRTFTGAIVPQGTVAKTIGKLLSGAIGLAGSVVNAIVATGIFNPDLLITLNLNRTATVTAKLNRTAEVSANLNRSTSHTLDITEP